MVPLDDRIWKWRNGDFCVRWWYKEVGRKIAFDILHLVEWDLILLESLEKMFKHITAGVAVTNRKPLAKIYNSWYWVSGKQGRNEWLALKKYVQKKFHYNKRPWAGIFGGASLSKEFLERYARTEIYGICNDEVRVPLFAQCFDQKVYDTGLKNRYFNADDKLILPATVYAQAKKGIKSFHPVRVKLKITLLEKRKNLERAYKK